jgi:hypothetical protein
MRWISASLIRLKVDTGQTWMWVHYPGKYSRYFEQRSPKLVLRKRTLIRDRKRHYQMIWIRKLKKSQPD